MKEALLALVLVVGACGASEKESSSGVGGNGGSPAADAGARNSEAGGGDVSQAQGGEPPSPATFVNRCRCGAGAQPPPECSAEPAPGSACDDEAFAICRVGFGQCFFCLASTPVGCVSEN
jgi:hypothetical protein